MKIILTGDGENFEPENIAGDVKRVLQEYIDDLAGKLPDEIPNYGVIQLKVTVEVV